MLFACFVIVTFAIALHSTDIFILRNSYIKLKIVVEAEAVKNNREIECEYRLSESMDHKWRNQQHMLFNGELKITANT